MQPQSCFYCFTFAAMSMEKQSMHVDLLESLILINMIAGMQSSGLNTNNRPHK